MKGPVTPGLGAFATINREFAKERAGVVVIAQKDVHQYRLSGANIDRGRKLRRTVNIANPLVAVDDIPNWLRMKNDGRILIRSH